MIVSIIHASIVSVNNSLSASGIRTERVYIAFFIVLSFGELTFIISEFVSAYALSFGEFIETSAAPAKLFGFTLGDKV